MIIWPSRWRENKQSPSKQKGKRKWLRSSCKNFWTEMNNIYNRSCIKRSLWEQYHHSMTWVQVESCLSLKSMKPVRLYSVVFWLKKLYQLHRLKSLFYMKSLINRRDSTAKDISTQINPKVVSPKEENQDQVLRRIKILKVKRHYYKSLRIMSRARKKC